MATGYDPKDGTRRDLDRDNDGRVDAGERAAAHRHDRGHDRGHEHGHDHERDVGRHDRVVHVAPDPGLTKEVRRDAYERGRADERSRHKRNPLLTFLIALAAVFGLAVIGLYIYNGGSFTETGRDLDSVTETAAERAAVAGREVADEAGEGLQDVGRRVEQEGEGAPAGTQPAPASERP